MCYTVAPARFVDAWLTIGSLWTIRPPPIEGRGEVTVFPGHHGGFSVEDGPWPGQAGAFAVRLRDVLAQG
ncbi:hypothetical protein NF556_02040 [Ornithinimicrobium faecis]|uniref:Uncharacterized protein n=1 Tax=Ornithinimicrobium faecis TaxID=2934158 RepID=A0ABY4YUM0_9MICO|nr:hypothetical protein [Ornithinimicrobium sp. HY1793]USQ80469.1 hypothetical protein NF556_02040 [Ornithinimicrobium sp. HY1793]